MAEFRILALQVCNWGYAPFQEPLPVGQGTISLGRNGSGKTTLLMGVQAALGHDVANVYRYVYKGRTWAWVRLIVDNSPVDGVRPFGNWVPDSAFEDTVTLAVLFERKDGWTKTYYVAPGSDFQPSLTDRAANRNFERTRTQYREMLDDLGILDIVLRLYRMGITGLPDHLKSPKGSFRFFFDLIGEQEIYEAYNQAKMQWLTHAREAEDLAAQVQADRARVDEYRRDLELGKRRREISARAESLTLLGLHAAQRAYEHQRQSLEATRATYGTQIDEAQRRSSAAQDDVDRLNERLQELEASFSVWRTNFMVAQRRASMSDVRFSTAQRSLAAVEERLSRLRDLPDESVSAAQTRLSLAGEREATALAERDRLAQRRNSLVAERRALADGRLWLPDDTAAVQARLDSIGIRYRRVSDALSIRDAAWARAIEGLLAGERFTIVVPDRAQRLAAMRVAQELEYQHWMSPARAVTPEALSSLHPDSLWHLVQVNDDDVAGWVFDRLARVRRVPDVESGERLAQQGVETMTPAGYYQRQRGGRSVVRGVQLACGGQARAERLRELALAVEEADTLLASAQAAHRAAREQAETARAALAAAQERLRLPELEAQANQLRADLVAARTEQTDAAAAMAVFNGQLAQWGRDESDLKEERARLEAEIRQAEQSLTTAQNQRRANEGRLREVATALADLATQIGEQRDLTPAEQQRLDAENAEAEVYRGLALIASEELAHTGMPKFHITDEMFAEQSERLGRREQEVADMRARSAEYQRLMDEAHRSFRQFIDRVFNDEMNKHFKANCQRIGARGSIRVVEDGPESWSMTVSAGFGGKDMLPLEEEMLSQGEKVTVGLLAVMSALQALHAAPLLVLDDFLGTLDDQYAAEVLSRARDVGCQYLVSTCQNRPELTTGADAIWVTTRRKDGVEYALPVKVQTAVLAAT